MTFDIDARMKQWDAANKAQHSGETEGILKSDTEKFQKMEPLPEGRDAASRAALFALISKFMQENNVSLKDINEFKDLGTSGIWYPADNERTMDEMGALSAAREMEKQKLFNEMDLFHMTNEKRLGESTAEKESQEKADNLRADVEKGKERAADSEGDFEGE